MRGVRVAVAAGWLAVAGCGGSSGGAAAEDEAATTAGAEEGGDATDGGRRRAARGAACDFGGAADLTCQRGLYCCYGPPDNPGDQGECMPECPEY